MGDEKKMSYEIVSAPPKRNAFLNTKWNKLIAQMSVKKLGTWFKPQLGDTKPTYARTAIWNAAKRAGYRLVSEIHGDDLYVALRLPEEIVQSVPPNPFATLGGDHSEACALEAPLSESGDMQLLACETDDKPE
jgi:hypothetical protein